MVNEEVLDSAVVEVITQLVSRPKFAAMMQKKISMKVDTGELDQAIENQSKQLRHALTLKIKLIEEIDSLDFDDPLYNKRKADLDDRLYSTYDRIESIETDLQEARSKKAAIEADKLTADNIYQILLNFEKLYDIMDEKERRRLMVVLVDEIQIHEERQPNGQWLKSIRFKLPIIDQDMAISLDNGESVETVVLLSKGNMSTKHIRVEFDLENLDTSGFQTGATYDELQAWVQANYGFHVTHLNIAQVKRKHDLDMRENYNSPKSKDSRQPNCPEEKEKAIEEALKHFRIL